MQGLGDDLLGKEHSMKPSDCEQRQPYQCLGCCHPCIIEMLWPGCRKEARSPRSVEMQGVLWLVRDELPENPSW